MPPTAALTRPLLERAEFPKQRPIEPRDYAFQKDGAPRSTSLVKSTGIRLSSVRQRVRSTRRRCLWKYSTPSRSLGENGHGYALSICARIRDTAPRRIGRCARREVKNVIKPKRNKVGQSVYDPLKYKEKGQGGALQRMVQGMQACEYPL